MTIKERLITAFWVTIVVLLFSVNYVTTKYFTKAQDVYEVYLKDKVIGFILDDDELYELINMHQKEIKNTYGVENVYPPEDFQIIKTTTYDVKISTAEEIYNQMAQMGSFTIKGYIINVKSEEDKNFNIYVLNKEIFDEAINDFVLAFVTNMEYTNYINNTQTAIETTGKIIELMYFDETLTIKEGYISVNDKIYTDTTDLTQYLLFGSDYNIDSYKIKSGDTIASISEANHLNTQEFLIANPTYTSVDSLLTIGDSVNITLINPILTFVYEVNEVKDVEIPYEKKITYDSSKSTSYSEITTPGVTGINRLSTQYIVKNGETQQGVITVSNEVITEKVDQVTTKGSYGGSWSVRGTYKETGDTWGWPTNYPYVITSYYAWRWGTHHDGVDISGTGFNSPIYAVLDGTVVASGWEGKCGKGGGYCIMIEHSNGYYTIYAHMAQGSLKVKEGDHVTRGQIIGGMGSTGISTGTHLHFGVSYGWPWRSGSYFIDPLSLYGNL